MLLFGKLLAGSMALPTLRDGMKLASGQNGVVQPTTEHWFVSVNSDVGRNFKLVGRVFRDT